MIQIKINRLWIVLRDVLVGESRIPIDLEVLDRLVFVKKSLRLFDGREKYGLKRVAMNVRVPRRRLIMSRRLDKEDRLIFFNLLHPPPVFDATNQQGVAVLHYIGIECAHEMSKGKIYPLM